MPIAYTDSNSPNALRFPDPRRRPNVIKLAQTYMACEYSRPVEQQTPFTPIIANLLQRLLAAEQAVKQAERERKSAASELERLLLETREIIWNMWKSVTAKCSGKPDQAGYWGFHYKANTDNVLLPKTLDERLETLNMYITKEQSLPQAERFTIPNLLEVISLCNTLESHADTRVAARRERESQIESCNALALELSNYLQSAFIYLLAIEFKFKLSKNLQNWGYDIAAKRSEVSADYSQ
ncbi:MAG: hypothetical protein KDJ52_14540 [Anaerolineae bacterium]|nr:hypothetical protein [Anaerolineae bacterium]